MLKICPICCNMAKQEAVISTPTQILTIKKKIKTMGIIFHKTLKCENCGYEYSGKSGGHVISNGEHYGISQYCCKTCQNIVDLECYSSLKENIERYIFPDGTETSYDLEKKCIDFNPAKEGAKDLPPFCQECGSHLFKLNIDTNEYAECPKCGHKSLKQKEIHVSAYID